MGNGRSKKKDLGAPKKSFWGRKKKKRDDVDEGKLAEPAATEGDDEEWDETQRGAEHFAAHYNYTNTRDLGKVRYPPPPLPLHTHTHTHTPYPLKLARLPVARKREATCMHNQPLSFPSPAPMVVRPSRARLWGVPHHVLGHVQRVTAPGNVVV